MKKTTNDIHTVEQEELLDAFQRDGFQYFIDKANPRNGLIADSWETMLHPHGVAVFLEAHHLCMEMGGVRENAPMTRTTVWRGHYAEDPTLRSEFFTACGLHRNER
jgi:hypothetical protein